MLLPCAAGALQARKQGACHGEGGRDDAQHDEQGRGSASASDETKRGGCCFQTGEALKKWACLEGQCRGRCRRRC